MPDRVVTCRFCQTTAELPEGALVYHYSCRNCGQNLARSLQPTKSKTSSILSPQGRSVGLFCLIVFGVLKLIFLLTVVRVRMFGPAANRKVEDAPLIASNNIIVQDVVENRRVGKKPIQFDFSGVDQLIYHYGIRVGTGEQKQEVQGECRYRTRHRLVDPRRHRSRRGVAILVSSEGHLIAPLNIVDHAEKLSARSSDGRFELNLVARNPNANLALLQIVSKDRPKLSTVPVMLAAKDPIEGTEVTVSGFNPKNWRSDPTFLQYQSRVQGDDRNNQQLPFAVLAGTHSSEMRGGACTGDFGRLVGILQSRNYAPGSRNLATFLPVSVIKKFLTDCDVKFHVPNIDVQRQPVNREQNTSGAVFSLSSLGSSQLCWELDAKVHSLRLVGGVPVSSATNRSAQVFVNQYGFATQRRVGTKLPFALGTLESLIFLPLDWANRNRWVEEKSVRAEPIKGSQSFATRFLSGETLIPANNSMRQTIRGEMIGEPEDGVVLIAYDIHLVSYDLISNGIEVQGKAEIRFRVDEGVPEHGKFKGVFYRWRHNKLQSKQPLAWEFERTTDQQIAEHRAAAERIAAARLKTPDSKAVQHFLNRLKSAETTSDFVSAMRNLSERAVVDGLSGEVLQQAKARLSHTSELIARQACRLLIHYSTPQEISDLKTIVLTRSNRFRGLRPDAAKKLIAFEALEFIPDLIPLIPDRSIGAETVEILKIIGAAAEPAVLQAIQQDLTDRARGKLVQLLGDIGTESGLQLLENQQSEWASFSQQAAAKAVGKIRQRIQVEQAE